jgi:hypothetical protein
LDDGLTAVLTDFFAVRALPRFAVGRLAATDLALDLDLDLSWGLRVIFGIIRVY